MGIVILDGLRPNVVFEYGILHGLQKPVILFREDQAEVDLRAFLKEAGELVLSPVSLDLDKQFSDAKDVNYAKWKRYELKNTICAIWEGYRKKRNEISSLIEIPEPRL